MALDLGHDAGHLRRTPAPFGEKMNEAGRTGARSSAAIEAGLISYYGNHANVAGRKQVP